jgi:hypothetical protein
MPIEILEAMLVHEAVILGVHRGGCARGDSFGDQLIDLGSTVRGQAHDRFRASGRVAELLLGESLEEALNQQHDVDVLSHDHAGRVLVGELRIKRIAQTGEEFYGPLQFLDRQVYKNLRCHD